MIGSPVNNVLLDFDLGLVFMTNKQGKKREGQKGYEQPTNTIFKVHHFVRRTTSSKR